MIGDGVCARSARGPVDALARGTRHAGRAACAPRGSEGMPLCLAPLRVSGCRGAVRLYGFSADWGGGPRTARAARGGPRTVRSHTRRHAHRTHTTRFTRDAAPAAAGEARARAAIPIEHRRPHRRAPVPAHRARGTSLHTRPLQERRIPTLATHRNTNVRFRCLVKPPPRGRGWTQCGSPWEGSCRCAPSTWPRGPPSPAAARARLAPAPPARLRTRSNPSGSRARPG